MIEKSDLQIALNEGGFANPHLTTDGIIGKKTMTAVDALLKSQKVSFTLWADPRRIIAAEQAIYNLAGIEAGKVDGLVGEQTRYARTVWAARLSGDKKKIEDVENWRDEEQQPSKSSSIWPKQNEGEMDRFFGPKGTNQAILKMPFPLRIAWEPAKIVRTFSCNKKILAPMLRIWSRTLQHYGHTKIKELRLDYYGGCLNVRKMRGGSAWSIHSWGCAYDIDPDRNQLKFKRASASLDDAPYKKFWEFVYDEGAISLGMERDYDWMHFQFARL